MVYEKHIIEQKKVILWNKQHFVEK